MIPLKLCSRDLFLLQGFLKYYMTIDQCFSYIHLLYSGDNSRLNKVYITQRLRKFFLKKIVGRGMCLLSRGLKPSYYFYLNYYYALRYVPELEDLPHSSKMFSPINSSLIEHELMITDIMLLMEKSFVDNGFQLVCFFRDGSYEDRFKFKNEVVSVKPDGVIIIQDKEGKKHLLFLEADRSSQELFSIGKWYHCIFRRLKKYESYLTSKKINPVSFFKFASARLLFVTKSEERIKNIITVCKNNMDNTDCFYLIPNKTLHSDKNLLIDGIWKGIKGNNCSLFQ